MWTYLSRSGVERDADEGGQPEPGGDGEDVDENSDGGEEPATSPTTAARAADRSTGRGDSTVRVGRGETEAASEPARRQYGVRGL